ncbi:hypothetical protein QJS66_01115 [Kocuria rhizophila]|nr:hypothetical protein QJS66_01115 [Kocuria rhizophila]
MVKTFLVRGDHLPRLHGETLELDDRTPPPTSSCQDRSLHRRTPWSSTTPRAGCRSSGLTGRPRGPQSSVRCWSSQQALVKRVIGVRGDHVMCCDVRKVSAPPAARTSPTSTGALSTSPSTSPFPGKAS